MSGLIVGDTSSASRIQDVHGAAGASRWKCFARRTWLAGDWEAVEWAQIPPGGISGEHRHSRTEEIYFIISGRGEILLDGVATEVGPGDVVLTGIGTTHGLRAVGDEGVSWLVIEVSGPETAAVLRGHA